MRSVTVPLLWKWTIRDLRERWLQVIGIAVIIALGVAVYSGLGSATPWRTKQLDESYAMLNMFDLRLQLTPGSYLEVERLVQAIDSVPHANEIGSIEARLRIPTSVSAATPERSLVVSGEIIGLDVTTGGPHINRLHETSGRALRASDAGEAVCILEHNFATYNDLGPGAAPIQIGGGDTLEVVGNAISPDHFMVVDEAYGMLGSLAQDRYAALFVPLETAQEIGGLSGQVNEVLITAADGLPEAGVERLKRELQDTMDAAFPQIGFELETVSEDALYRLLYDDIPGDQKLYDTFSSLLLLGAAFGAFILIGRIVEAQRREIGINMALGVHPLRIARRYLLVGAQIACLGLVLGAVLGLIINRPMGRLIGEMLPTPYFESPFQPAVFVRGALIGVLIPFLAIVTPIWQAVRVPPVDAIQTGYLVSKGGGLAPWLARLPLPGSSLALFPLRSLSRGVRRTAMTVLGLAMAIVVLIAILGVVDTFNETVAAGAREIKKGAPDRMVATLDGFAPLSGSLISGIAAQDGVAQAETGIVLPGQLVGDEIFDVVIQLLDLDNGLWTPTVVRGDARDAEGEPGILITEKAARDLGVDVGDRVDLNHLYRTARHAWRMSQTPVRVSGIHPDILRTVVYMDIAHAGLMNLDGEVNSLHLSPKAGVDAEALRQEIAGIKGVAMVQRAAATTDAVRDMLAQFEGVFVVVQLIVLLMTFLVAYNTTRSNIDERRRELATMFAFGTRVRTVLRMAIAENLMIGVLGTALGIGLGWVVMRTILLLRFGTMAPELSPVMTVSSGTLVLAVLFGVVVVALTPLVMVRRLVRMDIPSTLRVME